MNEVFNTSPLLPSYMRDEHTFVLMDAEDNPVSQMQCSVIVASQCNEQLYEQCSPYRWVRSDEA